MTATNGKQIRTTDVQGLYDILIADFQADPTKVPSEDTAESHALSLMAMKLKEAGYPMVQNLDSIIRTYNTKIKAKGGTRTDAASASDMSKTLFQFVTGAAVAGGQAAKPAQQATPNTAPAVTARDDASDASDQTTDTASVAQEPAPSNTVEQELNMNTDFTIDPAAATMIDTTLSNITSNSVGTLSGLLAAMSLAEATSDDADAANETVSDLVKAYTDGTQADESTQVELPDYTLSGFADLATDSPMVTVLDSLIKNGVTPAVTFGEIVTRIKNAEDKINEARLTSKGLQRDLRRVRPKDVRAVEVVKKDDRRETEAEIDELNDNVQVADVVASDIFTSAYGASTSILNLEVPTLEFDDVHPNVPKVDETFRFFAPVLAEALYSISKNEIMWLHGDSGCGKSEFWAQVAARLNMPFTRLNLDGHLTRSDIVGVNRMLPNEDRNMEMRFVEGILPRAMSRPGILMMDEFDLGDPEIMPIFQPILEGNPLVLLEDGGRVVHPHPMFRIVITGNTIGLGSENQMYNNAFEQSAATRDRISSFVRMPYMTPDIEKSVVMSRIPDAEEDFVSKLIQLANKVRDAFAQGEIHQIFSTRAVLYCANRYAVFAPHYPTPEDARDEILRTVVLGRMDGSSHNVVKGLIDNIFD